MKTLVFANQKGGVGKSAVATQFAHYLHRRGASVIVIDLDHQKNSSHALSRNSAVTVAGFTATDLFLAATTPGPLAGRLVLVQGDDRLSTLERQAELHGLFAGRLRAALGNWKHADVCIVDTNPNPDIRYAAALICGTHVLAPVQLNQEAIDGIAALFGHPRYGINRIQASLNPDLEFIGILPNLVEATPFQRANLRILMTRYRSWLLAKGSDPDIRFGYIHKRTALPEAQAAGAFIGDIAKTSARDTWREIRPVFDMIFERLGLSLRTEALR